MRDDPDDDKSYVPLSIMTARREVAQTIAEKIKQAEVIKQTDNTAMSDNEFEKFSAAIARGDIEPLTDSDTENLTKLQSKLYKQELERIGIEIVDDRDSNSIPHVNIDQKTKRSNTMKLEFDDDAT